MTNRTAAAGLLLALTTATACASSQFDRHMARGRYDDALQVFAADSTLWNREEALLRVAWAHALPESPVHDPARAREHLRHLLSLAPKAGQRDEANRLDALLAEILRLDEVANRHDAEIRRLAAAADSLGTRTAAQTQQLQTELRRRDALVQSLQQELERLKAIDRRLSQPRGGASPR